jgi:protein-tyrosine phosphatase
MSDKPHLLFVCTANQQRSPTAEDLFKDDERYEVKSCGTHAMSGTKCDASLMEWADVVICMEYRHKQDLLRRYPDLEDTEFEVLSIPDRFFRGDPELVQILRERLADWLE